MILAIKTDGTETYLALLDPESRQPLRDESWESGRQLSDKLLSHINDLVHEQNLALTDLSGIVAYLGPGSFTSLRIGLTVANALSDSLAVPISGSMGSTWIGDAIAQLQEARSYAPLFPVYGSEPNTTSPKA